jgi:carboxylate-amine ligase
VEIDLDTAHAAFDASADFTVGLEEEFALLDPRGLALTNRFDQMRAAAAADPVLTESISGELIASEIEIRSGRGEDLAAAIHAQRDRRRRLFALAEEQGVALGASGTHPWSDYRDQKIIETKHYQRVADDLKYVAWRNNTFSLHVHVGIRGADRAVLVCDRLRTALPLLLAISSSSPFLDGRDSGLHSARTQIFTKSFPRCGIPDAFGSWDSFARYVDFLARTQSIVEYTQVWWSIRPHFSFGTVEVRICDSQVTAPESEALASLIVACVAQAARDVDAGVVYTNHARSLIEENLWRATRYGLEGELIDLDRGETYPSSRALERLLEWCAPARAELGIEVAFPARNGAQRQRDMAESGISLEDVFAATVAETRDTYAGALEAQLKGST